MLPFEQLTSLLKILFHADENKDNPQQTEVRTNRRARTLNVQHVHSFLEASRLFMIEPAMTRVFSTRVAACLASVLFAMVSSADRLSDRLSTTELEQRLAGIDSELDQLARYHPRSGTGSIGYRSPPHPDPDHLEWVQVDLDRPTPLDQIVLVPAIRRDTEHHFRDDGFPEAFRILAGTGQAPAGTLVASFTEEDRLLPRIAPLVVPCSLTASWVRIEATTLSPAEFDGRFDLELAENGISGRWVHALEQIDTAPQSTISGFGFPDHLIVEGALEADFSDAVHLTEIRNRSIYEIGPVVARKFPRRLCRYLRKARC